MRRRTSNRTRLEGLIINNDKVLLIRRIKNGREYYVLPGGGWEKGETQKEGVKREIWEETSLTVKVKHLVFRLTTSNNNQHLVYLCQYLGGEPQLGDFIEKEKMRKNPNNIYQPVWLKITKLPKNFYPTEFRLWLLKAYRNGQLSMKAGSLGKKAVL